jgi:hypothetical protein
MKYRSRPHRLPSVTQEYVGAECSGLEGWWHVGLVVFVVVMLVAGVYLAGARLEVGL